MIKLELTEQMVAVIGAALGEIPFKSAQPVIAELQKQIDAQAPKADADVATDIYNEGEQ